MRYQRTLIICLVLAFVVSSCDQVAGFIKTPTLEPTPTHTPDPTSTPTPTLEPTPTHTPDPTSTPTPTLEPTPSNLISKYSFYEYETIDDPYDFYVENKGYIKSAGINVRYEYLNNEKGDNIEGNSTDGWYITYRDYVLYLGPGTITPNGVEFEVAVGDKDKSGAIRIEQRKIFTISEKAWVSIHFRTWWPGPPSFVYFPTKSKFVLRRQENKDLNYVVFPAYSGITALLITPDDQILPGADDAKWPEWCGHSDYSGGWASGTIGYTLDDEFIYWGKLPNGEIKCPLLATLEEN